MTKGGEMNSSNSTSVNVNDLAELIALDKALREAKFNSTPSDVAVAASPIVAELARRVRTAINFRTYGTASPPGGEDQIQPSWREWAVSVQAARRLKTWLTWAREKKIQVARDLLSPFEVSDENLELFVDDVDSAQSERP